MLRRSRLTHTASAIGALVLSLGLAVQPAAAGGGHHRGKYVGQLVVVPAGGAYVAPGSHGLVPVGASAGYYTPAAMSYYAPTAAYLGAYTVAAPAASSAAGYAGFTPGESAAYTGSPTLAAHLGGNFPLFHKKLTANAHLLKKNGVGGGQLLKILKDGALPILGEILGVAVPGSGPIFDEAMKIVEGIAGQVDPTAVPATTGEAPGTAGAGTTINVFLDTKNGPPTATAIVVGGARPAAVNAVDPTSGAIIPNTPPGTRPVVPVGGDPVPPAIPKPADDQPTMKDLKASIDELAAAVKLAVPAAKPADPAK
jgi:hypothetical protein